jgi:MFS family permease
MADRYDKRRILLGANAAFSVLALVLGILVATHAVTLAVVFILAVLMGTANAIETPVRQAFVSEIVPRELLPNALGLSAATFNTARIVGPAVAGVAIWLVGMGPVFLVNAVLCLAPLVFLMRMNPAELTPAELTGDRVSIPRGAALRVAPRRPDVACADHVRGRLFRLQLPAHAGGAR